MRDLAAIQRLVGPITERDLEHVDCAVGVSLGIFVPSTGFCKYAIVENHAHPGYSFVVMVTDGHRIVKPAIEVAKGSFLACAISPNVPHTEKTDEGFNRYYAVMIEPEFFERIYRLYAKRDCGTFDWFQFCVEADVLFYIRQFIAEYEGARENSDSPLSALSELIAHRIARALVAREGSPGAPMEGRANMERVREYIEQRFGERLDAARLADIAGLSVSHLERTFKRAYGQSPIQYLCDVRISKAKRLLNRSAESVIDIALTCGFSSPSNFASQFKGKTGVSPSQYRKTYRPNRE